MKAFNSCIAILILIVYETAASPLPRLHDRHAREHTTTVDCSNKEAVQFVLQSKSNFRCVYPNWNQRNSGRSLSAGYNPIGLMRERQKRCGSGFMYSPSVDMCLPASRPQVPQLVSDSLVAEKPTLEIESFANNPQSADDCPRGTMFSPSLGICSQIESARRESFRPIPSYNLVRDNPIAPLEIRAFDDKVSSGDDCKENQVYLAELDICIETEKKRSPPSIALASANQVRTVTNPPQKTQSQCADDEIYISEVGICVKDNPPSNSPSRRPISESLIRDKPAPVANKVAVSDPDRCPNGETFNPSIGACLPFEASNQQQQPPPSSNLVKEPAQMEITSFSNGDAAADCEKQGRFYIAELDICA